LKEATGGKGVNVVLEMVGEKNLNQDLMMLAQSGRIVVSICNLWYENFLTSGNRLPWLD
jgi:NADPH:quinone reductase-like Zn-dependent oxidoreductase